MSKAGKYIDLEDQVHDGAEYVNTTSFGLGIRYALNWLDEHPDQVPRRTITESERRGQIGTHEDQNFIRGFDAGLYAAGYAVVPDPEPTNAEKLRSDIEDLGVDWDVARDMARSLDLSGWVKAPGGDDEH